MLSLQKGDFWLIKSSEVYKNLTPLLGSIKKGKLNISKVAENSRRQHYTTIQTYLGSYV